MGQNITTWENRLRAVLGGSGVITTTKISSVDAQDSIKAAVRRFSTDRARRAYTDYSGDGVAFKLLLPAAWIAGFSVPLNVEHPVGNRPPDYLDMAEVALTPIDSAPSHVQLNETTPATGVNNVRLFWSVPWPIPTATAGDDKIADTDYEPVVHLSAYFGALQLAGRASDNTKSNLPSADAADFASEESEWREFSRAQLKVYSDHMSGGEDSGPAEAFFDWDARASWIATGRMFLAPAHRGRR